MSIPQEDFFAWAESAYLSTGHRRFSMRILSVLTGHSQPRISMQKGRGYIDSYLVVAFSRGLGLDPLEQLLKFPYYQRLLRQDAPATEEILALVSTRELAQELRYRLGAADRPEEPLMTQEEPLGFLRWYAAATQRGTGDEIAKQVGISASVLSSRNSRNSWSMEELHDLCEAGDLNYRVALVAARHLTLEEAGFPADLRERTLESADHDQFFSYFRTAVGHMARQARALRETVDAS